MSGSRDLFRTIDPDPGDVLQPQQGSAASRRFTPADNVEDAEFEVVSAPRIDRRPVQQALVTPGWIPAPAKPHLNHDPNSAAKEERDLGRLGVFAGSPSSDQGVSAPRSGLAAIGYGAGVAAVALVAFWMAGGHALFVTSPRPEPVAREATQPVDEPDISGISVAPAIALDSGTVEVIRSAPRPPRIERAGSILMIRGNGS